MANEGGEWIAMEVCMANERGEWIMKGLDWNDPLRIRSYRELMNWINEVGFLPLFANEVPGFSAEEHVSPLFWWTGDPEQDPWVWREIIPETGEVAYGKFFRNKAGFISKEWFPYFANARRDGYDFDSAWEDGLMQRRAKAIMDICEDGGLQMQTYLVIRRFERRRSKHGQSYGMPVSYYQKPEDLWGYGHVTSAYREDPKASAERIFQRARALFPDGTDAVLRKLLGIAPVSDF